MRKRFLTKTFFIVLDLKFPHLQPKTGIAIPYRMNQMGPVEKRDNSCTLKAADLATLQFEI